MKNFSSPDFITALSGKVKVAVFFRTTWFFSKNGNQIGGEETAKNTFTLGFKIPLPIKMVGGW